MCTLLQSNKLNVDELDVLSAVKDWASVYSVSRPFHPLLFGLYPAPSIR